MVFSSPFFLWVFLPLVLLAWALVRWAPRSVGHATLTLASLVFYGWSNPAFVPLLLLSMVVDFGCGWWIARNQPGASASPGQLPLCPPGGERARAQRLGVAASVIVNLGVLAFFKYANFGLDSWNAAVVTLGAEELAVDEFLRVALPLGISFYTFQSMSYTIDVYRGHARATTRFVDFACYVSLFTQLVAGPILRFSEVADQLVDRRQDLSRFARGVALFSLGMAKKVLLANPAGKVADLCFEAPSLSALDAWWGALAYAFQIYFDFSGYSDMAIGLALLFGFVFPKNFDGPYRSRSLTEFWRRWHISLSGFLRDYLYLPLGGNRRGTMRTYANLMIVMLLGGLWHGAAATFVVWGGIHGVGLAVERALDGRIGRRIPAPLRVAWTFALVVVAWVFFRASDLESALRYVGWMFGDGEPGTEATILAGQIFAPYAVGTMALCALVVWTAPQAWDWTRVLTAPKALGALLLLWLSSALLLAQAYNPFIYFIF